ncbi:MAG: 4Fe-4S dicluster domain-containing protein [Aquificae bacterium]|nr:4Fe-4S dicluster domain-containing protein [Aquificota bacterium]
MGENRIQLNFYDCLHVYYKDSSCQKCVEICPIDNTVVYENDKIKVNPENCISCGACVGVCPTEAFSLRDFSVKELFYKMTQERDCLISCKKNVPCASVFDVQYLISLALKNEDDIVIDLGYCEECQIGHIKEKIKENINEANYFLETLNWPYRVKEENIKYKPQEETKTKERREFLKRFGKTTAGLAFWALMPKVDFETKEDEKEFKNIVQEKILPDKRKVLIEALKEKDIDYSNKEVLVEKISFTSDKWIDNYKCTNCSVCYNVCPTSALRAGEDRLKILFEPSICIKCKICHEVCPEDCLYLAEKLNLKTFLEEVKILAEHVMIACEECLVPFSYKGDTTICPRCRQLEDEIRDLLQLGE